MKGIVDRFEEDIVVIELDNGVTEDFHRSVVNPQVKVGDCVNLINGIWVTNNEATKYRTNQIRKLMDELWAD